MGIATVLQHFRATSYISSEIATRIFCPLWFALQLFTFIVSFKQRFKQWSYFISNIIVHELQAAYITLRVIDRGALQTRQSKSDHFAIWVWWLFSKHFHRFLEFLHLQTKYLLQLCQWPLTALTLANLEFSLKARLYFLCLLVSTLVLGAKKLPGSDVLACCVTAWTRPGGIYIPMHQLSMRPQAVDLKETSKKCKRNDYSAIESPAICVQSGL